MPEVIDEKPSTHQTNAAKDALKEKADVFSHLRNGLGLVLVIAGFVGLMYLFWGSFAR